MDVGQQLTHIHGQGVRLLLTVVSSRLFVSEEQRLLDMSVLVAWLQILGSFTASLHLQRSMSAFFISLVKEV